MKPFDFVQDDETEQRSGEDANLDSVVAAGASGRVSEAQLMTANRKLKASDVRFDHKGREMSRRRGLRAEEEKNFWWKWRTRVAVALLVVSWARNAASSGLEGQGLGGGTLGFPAR